MISENLKKITDLLNKQGKMVFLEGATEEQILQFEKNNAIELPSMFKEWLQFSDGGECFLPAGVQFYGVAHKPTIDITDDDKPSDDYIVIGALASGDPILCEKARPNISIYNHAAGKIESDETFENFFAFIEALHDDVLGIGG